MDAMTEYTAVLVELARRQYESQSCGYEMFLSIATARRATRNRAARVSAGPSRICTLWSAAPVVILELPYVRACRRIATWTIRYPLTLSASRLSNKNA